jgi:hypothetical protein
MFAFAVAFVSAATVVFAVASFAGATVGWLVPTPWRVYAGAASLLILALVDVSSLHARSYCLIGARRQARQSLILTYSVPVVAAVWGFDTGLAVTTYRVSAMTWAAFALALLGFAPWWIGIAYGVALATPMLLLMFITTSAERLQHELRRRSLIQTTSAIVLATAGTFLLITP